MTNGNVTGLIESMANEGLVERAREAADRRVQVVRLTSTGKAAFDAMTPAHGRWVAGMMGELGRKEMAELYALLAKLKHSVGRVEGGARGGKERP